MKLNSSVKKTRTYYAFINTASLLLKEIVALICNFVVPRIIIGNFGSEYNGLVSSITQFLSLISILRLGVAGAMRYSLYKPLSENNADSLSSTVNGFQKYMQKTGAFAFAYIIILSVIYPFVFGKEFAFLDCFVLVIAIGSSVFTQYFIGLTYQTVLEADQKSFYLNLLTSFFNILVAVVTSVLALSGLSLPLIKLICGLLWTIPPFIIYFFVRKKYKISKKVSPNPLDLKRKNDVMVHSVANLIHENVDILALTILSTKIMVSIYSVYAIVINGLKQIVSIFTGSLEAPFGNMFARGEKKAIVRNLKIYEYIAFSLSSFLYSVALLLIIPFIKLYTHNVADANYIIPLYAFFAVVGGASYSIRIPYQTVVQAGGFYKETRIYAVLEALINVVISFALIPFIGISGVAIGTFIANLFRTLTYSYFLYKNVLHTSASSVWMKIIWTILNFVCIYCLASKVINIFASTGWAYWITCGFFSCLIAFAVIITNSVLFYSDELKSVVSIIKRKKKR